jgi:hypothetical protein
LALGLGPRLRDHLSRESTVQGIAIRIDRADDVVFPPLALPLRLTCQRPAGSLPAPGDIQAGRLGIERNPPFGLYSEGTGEPVLELQRMKITVQHRLARGLHAFASGSPSGALCRIGIGHGLPRAPGQLQACALGLQSAVAQL